jgi:hypothetical protein
MSRGLPAVAKVGSREAGDLDRWQVSGARCPLRVGGIVPQRWRGSRHHLHERPAPPERPRFLRSEMRQAAARHLTAGLSETPVRAWALSTRKQKTGDIVMKKRISIALAAGLLMAGASVASATEMKQSFSKVLPSPNRGFTYSQQHNIYAGHNNSKGQQHAAVRAPWHNVE